MMRQCAMHVLLTTALDETLANVQTGPPLSKRRGRWKERGKGERDRDFHLCCFSLERMRGGGLGERRECVLLVLRYK